MKTIAYTALHYGRDYLGSAIRSVIDAVDEYHVLYTAQGSHGTRTALPCPETRDELYTIAEAAAGAKLRWHDGDWLYENQQRESILRYAPDADVILVLDADEIWEDVGRALEDATGYNVWRVRLPMVHFWRSFHKAILLDPAFPERVINLRKAHQIPVYTTQRKLSGLICHMGYAQRAEIVEYKQHVHGHAAQWRTDCNWFEDRFLANAQIDCHPVGSEYWNPEPVNPWDYLPEWMKDHPYADLEVIE